MKMLRLLALFLVVATLSLVGRVYSVDGMTSSVPEVYALEIVLDQTSQTLPIAQTVSVSSGYGGALATSKYVIDYATGNTFLADQEVFDTSVFTEPNALLAMDVKSVIKNVYLATVRNSVDRENNYFLSADYFSLTTNRNMLGDVAISART